MPTVELNFKNFITDKYGSEAELYTENLIKFLKERKRVLFITPSNRWEKSEDVPKSTLFAEHLKSKLDNVKLVDFTKLTIYPCEGNVSDKKGNHCGTEGSKLKDEDKNPTGFHRCWCSINHKDDELWKVTKELFNCDTVLIFGSVRWGQVNSFYQKLIERLTWIENRHSSLGELNVVQNIAAGLFLVGQNWNGVNALETQKQVLKFYGFQTPDILFANWQYTENPKDETLESYKDAPKEFKADFKIR